jgi:hypothetical protein
MLCGKTPKKKRPMLWMHHLPISSGEDKTNKMRCPNISMGVGTCIRMDLREILEEASLNNAMIKLEKAVPYLLHFENCGSKVFILFLFIWALCLVE